MTTAAQVSMRDIREAGLEGLRTIGNFFSRAKSVAVSAGAIAVGAVLNPRLAVSAAKTEIQNAFGKVRGAVKGYFAKRRLNSIIKLEEKVNRKIGELLASKSAARLDPDVRQTVNSFVSDNLSRISTEAIADIRSGQLNSAAKDKYVAELRELRASTTRAIRVLAKVDRDADHFETEAASLTNGTYRQAITGRIAEFRTNSHDAVIAAMSDMKVTRAEYLSMMGEASRFSTFLRSSIAHARKNSGPAAPTITHLRVPTAQGAAQSPGAGAPAAGAAHVVPPPAAAQPAAPVTVVNFTPAEQQLVNALNTLRQTMGKSDLDPAVAKTLLTALMA